MIISNVQNLETEYEHISFFDLTSVFDCTQGGGGRGREGGRVKRMEGSEGGKGKEGEGGGGRGREDEGGSPWQGEGEWIFIGNGWECLSLPQATVWSDLQPTVQCSKYDFKPIKHDPICPKTRSAITFLWSSLCHSFHSPLAC